MSTALFLAYSHHRREGLTLWLFMLSYVSLHFFTVHCVNNQLRAHLIFSLKTRANHLDLLSVTGCLGIPAAGTDSHSRDGFPHGCSWNCSVVYSRDSEATDTSDLFLISPNSPGRMYDKRQFRLLLIFYFPKPYKRSVSNVSGCSYYSFLLRLSQMCFWWVLVLTLQE